MKYRTIIELICDAGDHEEASNIAGEYLRGTLDFGVTLTCKTMSVVSHRIKRYAAICSITLLLFSTLLLNAVPLNSNAGFSSVAKIGFQNTYTVTPVLKTKYKSGFRTDWENKKDEAVLDYLKK